MIAWKVIRANSRTSACIHGGAELHYPIGITVKPRDRRCPIMAFKNYGDARFFINTTFYYQEGEVLIVKCRVVKSKKKYFPDTLFSNTKNENRTFEQILYIWKNHHNNTKFPSLLNAYPGTILCSSVTPLE